MVPQVWATANIFALLTQGLEFRRKQTDLLFQYYERRKIKLQYEQGFLRSQLDEDRQKIVSGKRFLLVNELCRDAGLAGEEIRKLQLQGVSSTGEDGDTEHETHACPDRQTAHEVVEMVLSDDLEEGSCSC